MSQAHRSVAALGALLALCLGAPAGAQLAVTPEPLLSLQVDERTLELSISPEAFRGSQVLLRREGQSLRGWLRGQPVDIGWSGNLVTGRVGEEPVRARVRQSAAAAGLELEGLFAGVQSTLVLQPTLLRGEVGGCGYTLPLAGARYSGWRTCQASQGPPTRVVLTLPSPLASFSTPEEAVLLALLLSAEALPPPTTSP